MDYENVAELAETLAFEGRKKREPLLALSLESMATAIRELLAKGKNSVWISVDDHLPPDEDSGLDFFCMTTPKASCDGLIALTFEHTFVRGKEVRRWKWEGRLCPWEVTHWMPRPIPLQK